MRFLRSVEKYVNYQIKLSVISEENIIADFDRKEKYENSSSSDVHRLEEQAPHFLGKKFSYEIFSK